ncbi:unnamed protein product [Peniophora sp. CBMAI 1063]|nr:unnamed protein product [Peniophora sp. CBMAI 1063]
MSATNPWRVSMHVADLRPVTLVILAWSCLFSWFSVMSYWYRGPDYSIPPESGWEDSEGRLPGISWEAPAPRLHLRDIRDETADRPTPHRLSSSAMPYLLIPPDDEVPEMRERTLDVEADDGGRDEDIPFESPIASQQPQAVHRMSVVWHKASNVIAVMTLFATIGVTVFALSLTAAGAAAQHPILRTIATVFSAAGTMISIVGIVRVFISSASHQHTCTSNGRRCTLHYMYPALMYASIGADVAGIGCILAATRPWSPHLDS